MGQRWGWQWEKGTVRRAHWGRGGILGAKWLLGLLGHRPCSFYLGLNENSTPVWKLDSKKKKHLWSSKFKFC